MSDAALRRYRTFEGRQKRLTVLQTFGTSFHVPESGTGTHARRCKLFSTLNGRRGGGQIVKCHDFVTREKAISHVIRYRKATTRL